MNQQATLAWIQSSDHSWAARMRANLAQYGSLTANQLAASERIMTQAAPQAQTASLDLSAIEQAFTKARRIIAKPKMTLKHFTFKSAPQNGKNPGAIYITDVDSTYLGKVFQGTFSLSRDCTPEQLAEIKAIAADPKQAAIAHGKAYGICCICNRTLTDPNSISAGIGPVCSARFGW